MRQHGEHLCPSLFKLQFILEKIILTFHQESVHAMIETVTGKLIADQTETTNIPVIDRQRQPRPRTTLLTDKAVQFATAKTCFSDSVLCLGGISSDPVRAWKDMINWFMQSRHKRELDRIDGLPMEFE